MKALLILGLSIMLSMFSFCTSEETKCLDAMIDEFTIAQADRSFVGIYRFQIEDENFYVFDSGVAFDATASVVNESCEQVCIYGGLRANSPLPCDAFWDGINNSTQIWP